MLTFVLLAIFISLISASVTPNPRDNPDYQREILPYYSKYGAVDHDGSIVLNRFINNANVQDIMRVLVAIRPLLPEISTERTLLRNGFYKFYFKANPVGCSEFLMALPEGHLELERILRMDRDITIFLTKKLVSQRVTNMDVLRKILSVYSGEDSFLNKPLETYNYSVLFYNYLLHEACEHGNVEAASLLLDHGADPLLLAGNSHTGLRRTAIHAALRDRRGTGTLRLMLDRVDPAKVTDHMKVDAMRQIMVDPTMPEDLRQLKIDLLQEYGYY